MKENKTIGEILRENREKKGMLLRQVSAKLAIDTVILSKIERDERINQLTVIPNETYQTFITQYQEEIKEVYDTDASTGMTHTHKVKPQNEVRFKRSVDQTVNKAFCHIRSRSY